MKKAWLLSLWIIIASFGTASADIKRIDDGGLEVDTNQLLQNLESVVLVFHASWDQASITLLEQLEEWSGNHTQISFIFIDIIDDRSQVYRQFRLRQIPSMIIYDRDQQRIGGTLHDVDALESALNDADLL